MKNILKRNSQGMLWLETVAFGLILLSMVFVSEFMISTYISLLAIIFYFILLIFRHGDLFVKYFFFVFFVCANIAGCLVIESQELFLSELRVNSGFAGSAPLLIFSRWLFVAILLLCDSGQNSFENRFMLKDDVGNRKNWIVGITVIVLCANILLFLQVAPRPSFVLGLDSFDYATLYGVSGVWQTIANIMSYAVAIPAMAIRLGKKRLGIATIGVYILYLLWTGNKFGNFLNICSVLLLVFADKIFLRGERFMRNAALLCLSSLLALVGFSLLAHSFTSDNDTFEYLFSRTAQQGQLWWKTYERYDGEPHVQEFQNEIDMIGEAVDGARNNIGSKYGIYAVMYATTPSDVVDRKLAAGSTYTEAGYPAMLYYFGKLGPIVFSIIGALVVAVLTKIVLLAIIKDDFVVVLVSMRLLVISHTAINMFIFTGFFDELSLLSYLFLGLMVLMSFGYKGGTKGSLAKSMCAQR